MFNYCTSEMGQKKDYLFKGEELFLHDKKQAVCRFAATRKNYVLWNSDIRLIAK